MKSRLLILPFLISVYLLLPAWLYAQGLNTTFGKNVLQHKQFDWSFYRTENFDIYFYLGGKELARYIHDNGGDHLKEIERIVDYPLGSRITFIIYNSYTDYRQSNFRVNEESDNITSPAKAADNKVFLYFDGRHRNFEEQIRTGMAKVVLSEMILGGTLQERVQNNILLNLPQWYIDGLINYLGKEWNPFYESKLKNGVLSGRFKRFRKLSDKEATLIGHSIWMYVHDRYGPEALADIIYIMRTNKSVESGYLFVLGKPFIDVYEEWYQFHLKRYEEVKPQLPSQVAGKRLQKIMKKGVITEWGISVKGDYAAVTLNDMGKAMTWVIDLESGKKKRIFKQGYKRISEQYDHNYPVTAWNSRMNELTLVFEKKARVYYIHYNTETKKKTKKQEILRVDRVLSLDYALDGRRAVMSVINKGQTDLMTFDFRSRRQLPLTDDVYDDLEPKYVHDGEGIVFTSNRADVMLDKVHVRDNYEMLPDMDVFYLRDPGNNKKLKRLSFSAANESLPDFYDTTYFSYLSDQGGTINRYASYLDSIFQFIRVVAHSKDTSLRRNDTLLFYVNDSSIIDIPPQLLHDSLIEALDTEFVFRDTAYTYKLTNYSENILMYDTRHSINTVYELFSTKDEYIMSKRPLPNDIRGEALPANSKNFNRVPPIQLRESTGKPLQDKPGDSLHTVYRPYFQSDFPAPKITLPEQEPATAQGDRRTGIGSRARFGSSGLYFVTFQPDNFVTQFDNSIMNSPYLPYKPGDQAITSSTLNGMFKVGMSDVFKDYRIIGGFRMQTSFRGASYFITVEDLRKKIDKRLIFFRRSEVKNLSALSFYRESSHEIRPEIAIPFSEVSRMQFSIFGRLDKNVYLTGEKAGLLRPTEATYWGGTKVEYVIDNTISRGMNLYNGTRMKMYGELFNAFNHKETLMKVIGADMRHYTPLFRNIIWANRLTGATSTGQAKIIYIMGGVDNWLFPKYDNATPVDTSQNFVYKALATNLRGFSQNVRNGNSYMAFSSELRIPVFKAIVNRPVRQQFLESFQVVGFFDAGSAWVGTNPFSIDNSINRRTLENYPFAVTITSRRDPIVFGYGFGFRTVLLGYFVKMDYAWGTQDDIRGRRMIYLSFGMDF